MKKKHNKKVIHFPIRCIIEIKPKNIIVILCTLIGIIFSIMQIFDWVKEHKKLDIVMQYGYLDKNIEHNFYPLFEDYIDSKKEYMFSENCATTLMITNHYNNEVVIDKIILDAIEIEVDYSPILTFENGFAYEEGISVNISNSGWGAAKNLNIKIIGNDIKLEEYFKKEALEFTVPIINSSEVIEVPFLKNSDLLESVINSYDIAVDLEVECECEGNPTVYNNVGFYIENGKLDYGGKGAFSQYVYGINIDTLEENFLWEESILEFIPQGETIVLPVCFFPDKSCSLKLKIAFEIINDGKKELISTELLDMYFSVSSIPEFNDKICIPIENLKDMTEMDSYFGTIISYPENPATLTH